MENGAELMEGAMCKPQCGADPQDRHEGQWAKAMAFKLASSLILTGLPESSEERAIMERNKEFGHERTQAMLLCGSKREYDTCGDTEVSPPSQYGACWIRKENPPNPPEQRGAMHSQQQ